MKRLYVVSLVILGVAGAAYIGWKWETASPTAGADAPTGGKAGSGKVAAARNAQPTPVVVAEAKAGSLPIQRTTIGTIVPVATTAVSSPAAGIVAKVLVKDGALVKAGDLLVQLDDRALVAAVGKDKASLARDQATLDNANTSLKRIQDLVNKGIDTSQSGDDALAAVKVAEAQIGVDEAQLAADNVALTNTKILAPFDGQLGVVLVSAGAYVGAGTSVATVTQMKPVYAEFSVSESDLQLARNALTGNELKVSLTPTMAITGSVPVTGAINFIDNNVDNASGTFKLRATLANDDGALWPGQSLNVQMQAGDLKNLILVPNVAVMPQENGSISYVVKADGTIETRPVTVAVRVNDMAGISHGLNAGDKVVVEGQANLSAGSKVHIVDKPQASAPKTLPKATTAND